MLALCGRDAVEILRHNMRSWLGWPSIPMARLTIHNCAYLDRLLLLCVREALKGEPCVTLALYVSFYATTLRAGRRR